jgi:starch synthase
MRARATRSVLAVVSELYPLVKTGGLADVAGALPLALAAEGIAVTTMMPGYPAVMAKLDGAETVATLADLFGGPASLRRGRAAGLDIIAIDAPHLYARPGNLYAGPDGRDWPDNARRFAGLGAAAAMVARDGAGTLRPDILHAHDWQAGLAPAYLHYGGPPRPGSVATIHNLAFQGRFPLGILGMLGLPPAALAFDGIEHHGEISYLKAALQLADRVTTVSPTYADEIRTAAGGMGLDPVLRWRGDAVSGIRNGIDVEVWNPATDPDIAARYDARDRAPRARNKQALQEAFGLAPDPARLLLGVVSRLTGQKGLDLLLACLDDAVKGGAQLVLLGNGEPQLEAGFAAAAAARPRDIGCRIGYDERLAHRIQAGIDALVVPSRFEPCGLTQLCALRYGAVPIVAGVGGLADTVTDTADEKHGTGFVFRPVEATALAQSLTRALAMHRKPAAWSRLVTRGMTRDVSWREPARAYAALYREVAASMGRG